MRQGACDEMGEVLDRVLKQVQTGRGQISAWQQQQHQAWHHSRVVRPQQQQQRQQAHLERQQELARERQAKVQFKCVLILTGLGALLLLLLYFGVRSVALCERV
jgi:hypothetical protein